MVDGLEGDPKRQASDSIRGYQYQMWQSVHAWLELEENELLFLEGAEDIDVVSDGEATAVQVKDTQANVTLRSKSVIDSIDNYWKLRQDHPSSTIQFRYITTAGIGIEQKSPFGEGISGLGLWQECAKGIKSPKALRTFLIAEDKLCPKLLSFLNSSNDTQLRDQLIGPITWEILSPDSDAVQTAVKRKLANYGSGFSVYPSKSEAVADKMLTEVFEVASRKRGRHLTRYDFITLFELATTEPKTAGELQTLRRLAGQAGIQPAHLDSGLGSVIQRGIPHEVSGLLVRSQLLQELGDILRRRCILSLKGSTGMGKTTLAKNLVKAIGGECLWVSLTDKKEQQLKYFLDQVGFELDTSPDIQCIVLDDMDLEPSGARLIEDTLGGLLYTAQERGTLVVVTTHRDFPARLSRSLAITQESQFNVLDLTIDEISELAKLHGCPCIDFSRAWAAVIAAQTSGHPQLVHARIARLEAEQWPDISESELSRQPEEIIVERADTRSMLLKYLSDDAIGLLYRLSALGGMFRRDHAIAIGEIEPPLSNTALRFNSLVGPWVEPVGSRYFRVSQLLKDAAPSDWSAEKLKQFRICAATQIASCGDTSLIETSELLMLSFLTESSDIFVPIVHSLLSAANSHWPQIATELSWVLFFATKPGQFLFPEDSTANQMLRHFQFRVAAEVQPDEGTRIVDLCEQEFSLGDDVKQSKSDRLMFALKVCIYYQVPISGSRFIAYLDFIDRFRTEDPELNDILTNKAADGGEPLSTSLPFADPVVGFFAMAVPRCDKDAFLSEMFESLACIDEAFRNRLLGAFSSRAWLANQMLSAVWLHEAEKESPDWDACCTLYRAVFNRAVEWNCPELIEAAARANSIVLEEYKRDPQAALEELDSAAQKLGEPSYVIEDGRATTLFHHGHTEESLAIWLEILPKWQSTPPVLGGGTAMFSCSKAGIAAMKLGRWENAETMFLEGSRRATNAGQEDYNAGFLADAAYACWKAGDIIRTLQLFEESLNILERIPNLREEIGTFTVYKFLGATILWCTHNDVANSMDGIQEPVPGWCSNPRRNEEIMHLPFAPFDYSWLNLVSLEYSADSGTRLYTAKRSKLETSPYTIARFGFAELSLRLDFRCKSFDSLPCDIARLMNEKVAIRELRLSGKDSTQIHDIFSPNIKRDLSQLPDMSDVFVAALLVAVSEEANVELLLGEWKTNCEVSDQGKLFDRILQLASLTLAKSSHEIQSTMSDESSENCARLLSALRICMLDDASPAVMLCAQVQLTDYFSRSMWAIETAESLAGLVTAQWRRILKCGAALRTPRLTIPEIERACNTNCGGFAKAAKVLLAASDAVSIRLSADLRNNLEQLAQATTH